MANRPHEVIYGDYSATIRDEEGQNALTIHFVPSPAPGPIQLVVVSASAEALTVVARLSPDDHVEPSAMAAMLCSVVAEWITTGMPPDFNWAIEVIQIVNEILAHLGLHEYRMSLEEA